MGNGVEVAVGSGVGVDVDVGKGGSVDDGSGGDTVEVTLVSQELSIAKHDTKINVNTRVDFILCISFLPYRTQLILQQVPLCMSRHHPIILVGGYACN